MKKNRYIVRCKNCKGLAKFKFNKNNFKLIGECYQGHYFSDLTLDEFTNNFIINSQTSKSYDNPINVKCYNCDKEVNKIFLYNLKYDFFNNNDKIYLCQECIKNIPLIEKESEIKMKIKSFNEKIEQLENSPKIKSDQKNFDELSNFFYNLKKINETLLMNFNYSIYDEYNYDNFNYFFNYNEDFLKSLNLEPINTKENNTLNIKIDKLKKVKNINVNYCFDYYSLKYFKRNLFFIYLWNYNNESKELKIFEYKNFSFKCICTYNCTNISFNYITTTDYNHFFLYEKYFSNNMIAILEYSDKENVITLKEIVNINININKQYIKNIIENKNGNIIIKGKKNIIILSKVSDKYEIVKIFNDRHYTLIYNINDYYFLSANGSSSYYIYIHDIQNYNIIKTFFLCKIKYINQNKEKNLLILMSESVYYIYFINIKYWEIIQKIRYQKTNFSFLISNDINFFNFILDEKNKMITIRKYSIENGCFYEYRTIKSGLNYDIYLSNDCIYLINKNKIKIFLFND